MRGFRELIFSVTNKCNARCQDCPVVHNGQSGASLTPRVMVPIVDEVRSWGSLLLVVFTGGEPFLLGKDLRDMVGYVARAGIMTRIVTNAYWARSKQIAIRILSELKELGLTEINFSCDEYHQAYVPIERVRFANEAAYQVGLPALLAFRQKPGGSLTVESLSESLGVKLERFKVGGVNPDNNVIHVGTNVPILSLSRQTEILAEDNYNDSAWRGGCESVLNGIVISPDLRVQICCGIAQHTIPELSIGSLAEDDLLTILQRGNKDLITNWLGLEGPSSILDFVRSKDPALKLSDHYVNKCHLCNELFTNARVRDVLQAHAEEHLPSILLMRATLDWTSDAWAPQVSAMHPGALSNAL